MVGQKLLCSQPVPTLAWPSLECAGGVPPGWESPPTAGQVSPRAALPRESCPPIFHLTHSCQHSSSGSRIGVLYPVSSVEPSNTTNTNQITVENGKSDIVNCLSFSMSVFPGFRLIQNLEIYRILVEPNCAEMLRSCAKVFELINLSLIKLTQPKENNPITE
jgi:hypothetical protein